MTGAIAALHIYPIKGFTPQPIERAALETGRALAGDRLMAIEIGPCGFDPAAPAHVPKMRFAVLARLAEVARVRTRYDVAAARLHAEAPGTEALDVPLDTPPGRAAFAAWLTEVLGRLTGEPPDGPLRLLEGEGWRFLDHPLGHVSILNLASVRDLEARLGRPIDPLRFRANLHVEGWPAWIENDLTGARVRLGAASAKVFEPIVRCAATQVDPDLGVRDIDVPAALRRLYGHLLCGIYVHVEAPGEVAIGDAAELL